MNTQSILSNPLIQGWQNIDKNVFLNATANEQIDLYQFYTEARVEEKRRDLKDTVVRGAYYIEMFEDKLKEEGFIKVLDAFIRINGKSDVSALILVDNDTFINERFEFAYSTAQSIEHSARKMNINIDFNFASKTDYTNEHKIAGDGFYLKRSISVNEHKATR